AAPPRPSRGHPSRYVEHVESRPCSYFGATHVLGEPVRVQGFAGRCVSPGRARAQDQAATSSRSCQEREALGSSARFSTAPLPWRKAATTAEIPILPYRRSRSGCSRDGLLLFWLGCINLSPVSLDVAFYVVIECGRYGQ